MNKRARQILKRTCQWAPDDEWNDEQKWNDEQERYDPPRSATCSAPATHRGCKPFAGAVTCEAHKCRCAHLLWEEAGADLDAHIEEEEGD